MKEMLKTRSIHKSLLLVLIMLGIMIIGVISWIQVKSADLLVPTATSDPFHTYDPATYDVPAIIAGYKTLAVQTPENTACMMPGDMRLLLQALEANAEGFLANVDPKEVMRELEKLDISKAVKWEIQYLGPRAWNQEKFIADNEAWDSSRKANGCLKSDPITLITPIQIHRPYDRK